MRYFEIAGGFRMPVSSDEQEILTLLKESENLITAEELDEYQLELATKMVSRGLLNRLQKDGKIYYEPNGLPDIWRI
jgi:hypothetical protein